MSAYPPDFTDRLEQLRESTARFCDSARPVNGADYPEHEPESVTEPKLPIEARVFQWPDIIHPRPWVYGKHYMRGMASATAGIGGSGKSTLVITEAVSIAIGRDLFHHGAQLPLGPLTVWVHNGEDPLEELQRRIVAICRRNGVTKEDLGARLRVTSGRDSPVMLAHELSAGGRVLVPTDHGRVLAEQIQAHNVAVFMADPFVSVHRVNENDNSLIDGVMTIARDLAHDTSCAIEFVHHFRKTNGQDVSIEDIRGASSIVGACRSARIVAQMTGAEAEAYGINPDDRRGYIWMMNGKANMQPPTCARRWFHLEPIDLENAAGPYESDKVGVAVPWEAPDNATSLTPEEFRHVRRAICESQQPLNDLRYDVRSSGWAGKLIGRVLERNVEDKDVKKGIQRLIDRLLKNKTMTKVDVQDPRQGRVTTVVRWTYEGTE
jgi:hypothetical protein